MVDIGSGVIYSDTRESNPVTFTCPGTIPSHHVCVGDGSNCKALHAMLYSGATTLATCGRLNWWSLTHGLLRFITFIAVAGATIDLRFVLTSPASFVRVHVRVQRRLRRIIHLFTNARETRGKKLR